MGDLSLPLVASVVVIPENVFLVTHDPLYVGDCLLLELIWCTSMFEILITFPVALNFLGIFSNTVVEDMILTPSGTIGTNKQVGGTQDLWSSLRIF